MRILAVDPGEKHIGLALSDEAGVVARPLATLAHAARARDAQRIAESAASHGAGLILIGQALDDEGQPGPQARRSQRLAEAVRAATAIPVQLVDESLTSEQARAALRESGRSRVRIRESIHAAAAAALLQGYLDERARDGGPA